MAEADGYATPGCGDTKARVITTDLVLSDGSVQTVSMQVVAVASPDGKLADPDTTKLYDTMLRVEDLLGDIRELLQEMCGSDLKASLLKKGMRQFSMVEKDK